MCEEVYICTDYSKWDTCRVEKMGCQGCYYFQQLYKIADEPENDKEDWKKKIKIKGYRKEK